MFGPEHRQVGLRCAAKIGEGMEAAEGILRHQRFAIDAHAADGLGDPGGITAEELVILRRAQVAHQPQLDDELIHQLLGPFLGEDASLQVPLDVDVQEGGRPAQRGGGAVVLFDAGEIRHIQKLHCLMGVCSGLGQVHPIPGGHGFHLPQSPDLLRHFLPQTDTLLVHGAVQLLQILLFKVHQPVDAVQGHPAVIADDAATAVGVGQSGEEPGVAGVPGALGIGVKDALVVGFAVLAEVGGDFRIQLITILLQSGFGHPGAAVEVHDALEGRIGLQAHDDLVLLVDVAGGEVVDAADDVGLHIQNALLQLLEQQLLAFCPDLPGALGGAGQETFVTVIGGHILLNEGAHVHRPLPLSAVKTVPLGVCHHAHFEILLMFDSCFQCRSVSFDQTRRFHG